MLTLIIGASGSGKTTISRALVEKGYKEIVTCTTRAKRENEKDGIDYHFLSLEDFRKLRDEECFLEIEEYSENRFYGTLKSSIKEALISKDNYVLVVTPNGMRKIKEYVPNCDHLLIIYITASLGIRVKRYIDRIGDDKFNFSDMNEINARVNRDFGMFLNIEESVDYVIENNGKNEPEVIADFIKEIGEKNE